MTRAVISIDGECILFDGLLIPTCSSSVWAVVDVVYPDYDKELYNCEVSNVDYKLVYSLSLKDELTLAGVFRTRLTKAVQVHLDSKAQEKGYDNIFTACTYANSTNATFQSEANTFVAWRDNVWAYCYQVMADVQGQTRTIPTEVELISELPQLVWS